MQHSRHSCRHRHGEHIKDFLWRTKRTKSLWATIQRQEIKINWNKAFSQHAQRWGGREDEPIILLKQPCCLSLIFFYATSFYLKRKCSVPTGLLIMWHTPDVPSSHYADVKPSPWQSHTFLTHLKDPSHLNSKLNFIFSHCTHTIQQIKTVFQHLKCQKQTVFRTVSCPVKSWEEWGRVSLCMSWHALR